MVIYSGHALPPVKIRGPTRGSRDRYNRCGDTTRPPEPHVPGAILCVFDEATPTRPLLGFRPCHVHNGPSESARRAR